MGNKIFRIFSSLVGLFLIIIALLIISITLFTDFIPEHSLIYVLDIPDVTVILGSIFVSLIFLLVPGFILISFNKIINLLEKNLEETKYD
ncbi:MAG: hypothetical protein ACQEQG_06790 [Bacillota bacterium]